MAEDFPEDSFFRNSNVELLDEAAKFQNVTSGERKETLTRRNATGQHAIPTVTVPTALPVQDVPIFTTARELMPKKTSGGSNNKPKSPEISTGASISNGEANESKPNAKKVDNIIATSSTDIKKVGSSTDDLKKAAKVNQKGGNVSKDLKKKTYRPLNITTKSVSHSSARHLDEFSQDTFQDSGQDTALQTSVDIKSSHASLLSVHDAHMSNESSEEKKEETSDVSILTTQQKLKLETWGLPVNILKQYAKKGITEMFQWQVECLCCPRVLNGGNLVYSAPTSAGKTLVSEILCIKTIIERRKKVLFILPFVSVVREKMFYFQELLKVSGIRVDGYMGSHAPPGGFRNVDMAICTIEKANSLINRLMEENSLTELGAVIVDELHLLGDSHRGYLLELLLTKLKYMSSKKCDVSIQLVGMSATLPNLSLLSSWLDADLYKTSFRPIPLEEFIKVGNVIYNNSIKPVRSINPELLIKNDAENLIYLCLETIAAGHSVLIFCPTKNWCESLAQSIASEFRTIGQNRDVNAPESLAFKLREELNTDAIKQALEQLRRCPVGLDSILGKVVSFGVAYHHAGLTMDERDIVEGCFRNGTLRVIVATSTLSSGVNLPARRVIIRSPVFHGRPIDILTYRQMIGRAGRMGVDSAGESILICQKMEQRMAESLVRSELRPVESCLGQGSLSASLKRAILEVIASGVASTPEDVELYTNCTLLAASFRQRKSNSQLSTQSINESQRSEFHNPVSACVNFLNENEFIRLQEGPDGVTHYVATPLGQACLSASLPPDEGLLLLSELQRARQCFVLENELHVIYQVTPFNVAEQWGNLDWLHVLALWEQLTPEMKRVGELIGIEDRFIVRAMRGTINHKSDKQVQKLMVHRRFYTALALHDLVNEVPLNVVASKFNCNRGMLQSLQQSASTYAGMVTSFCRRLGWSSVELLVGQFQDRLQFGTQRELLDLLRLPSLNGPRARALYDAGITTLTELTTADVLTVENALHAAVPFLSDKERDGETTHEAETRRKLKGVWITGRQGLTEREAAELIINEARSAIQLELGLRNVNWEQAKPDGNETKSVEISVTQGLVNTKQESVDLPQNDSPHAIAGPSSDSSKSDTTNTKMKRMIECLTKDTNSENPINSAVKMMKEDRNSYCSSQESESGSSACNSEELMTCIPKVKQENNNCRVKEYSISNQHATKDQNNAEITETRELEKDKIPQISAEFEYDDMGSLRLSPSTSIQESDEKTCRRDSMDLFFESSSITNSVFNRLDENVDETSMKNESVDSVSNRLDNVCAAPGTTACNANSPQDVLDESVKNIIPKKRSSLDIYFESSSVTNTALNKLSILQSYQNDTCAQVQDDKIEGPGNTFPDEFDQYTFSDTALANLQVYSTDREEKSMPENHKSKTTIVSASEGHADVPRISEDTTSEAKQGIVDSPNNDGCYLTAEQFTDVRKSDTARTELKHMTECDISKRRSSLDFFSELSTANNTAVDKTSVLQNNLKSGCAEVQEDKAQAPGNTVSDEFDQYTFSDTALANMQAYSSNKTGNHDSPSLSRTVFHKRLSEDMFQPSEEQDGSPVLGKIKNDVCANNTKALGSSYFTPPSGRALRIRTKKSQETHSEEREVNLNFNIDFQSSPLSENPLDQNIPSRSPSLFGDSFEINSGLCDVLDGQENKELILENAKSEYAQKLQDSKCDRPIESISGRPKSPPVDKLPSHCSEATTRAGSTSKERTSLMRRKILGSVNMLPGGSNIPMKDDVPISSVTDGLLKNGSKTGKNLQDSQKGNCHYPGLRRRQVKTTQQEEPKEKLDISEVLTDSFLEAAFQSAFDNGINGTTNRAVIHSPEKKGVKSTLKRLSPVECKDNREDQPKHDLSPNECKRLKLGVVSDEDDVLMSSQEPIPSLRKSARLHSKSKLDSRVTPKRKPSVIGEGESVAASPLIGPPKSRSMLRQRQESLKQLTEESVLLPATLPVKASSFNSFKSFKQQQILDWNSFSIIDVCGSNQLFASFSEAILCVEEFSVSLACEALTEEAPQMCIGKKIIRDKNSYHKQTSNLNNGLSYKNVCLVGISFCFGGTDAYYISLLDGCKQVPLKDRVHLIRKVLGCNSKKTKKSVCCFDIKEHYKMLYRCTGIALCDISPCDPKVADWLLDPEGKEKNLQAMVVKYLEAAAVLVEQAGNVLGGVGSSALDTSQTTPARQRSSVEAILSWHLVGAQRSALLDAHLLHSFLDVEMPMLLSLACMELNGIGFDSGTAETLREKLESEMSTLEERAYQLAGRSFSLTSPTDISRVIYQELKLGNSSSKMFCKKSGATSTSKAALGKLCSEHPLPGTILLWRKMNAVITKIVCPLLLPQLCTRMFGQCIVHTATGRISMYEPNLQNIPRDFDISPESPQNFSMRMAFVPYEGNVMVAADYSQLELRLLAHLSRDAILCDILNSGRDVFRSIAAAWHNLPDNQVSDIMRQRAKQICYGMIYGMGARALAEQLEVEESEAAEFMDSFRKAYPGVQRFLRQVVESCKEKGYVETLFGRRRYLPAINNGNPHVRGHAERQAVNTTVQGSAADLAKSAMVGVDKAIRTAFSHQAHVLLHTNEMPAKQPYLVLHLHDELLYEVPRGIVNQFTRILQSTMESTIQLSVKLPVKVRVGDTWGTLEEISN